MGNFKLKLPNLRLDTSTSLNLSNMPAIDINMQPKKVSQNQVIKTLSKTKPTNNGQQLF